MTNHRRTAVFIFGLGLACTSASWRDAVRGAGPIPKVVEYNRDIRPILSENCYACHGPDKNARKAKLELYKEEGALADRGGYQPLVPGKPDESELFQLITTDVPPNHGQRRERTHAAGKVRQAAHQARD